MFDENALQQKELELQNRQKKIEELEKSIGERELFLKEKAKKQLVLRLSPSLWEELAAWSQDDFRSINSQIEFLLSEAVRRRNGKKE